MSGSIRLEQDVKETKSGRIIETLDVSVEKIEKSRWFKVAVIVGVLVTLASAITLIF